MRHILSWSCGIAAALMLVILLHLVSALGTMELLFSGILACALVVNWTHELTPVRRAAVRLRILFRRQEPVLMNRLARLQERVTAMRSKALERDSRQSELRRHLEFRFAAIGTGLIQAARRTMGGVSWLASLGRDERLQGLFDDEPTLTVRERLNPMWLSYVVLSGWAVYEVVAVSQLAREPMQQVAQTASSAVDAVASTSAAVMALGSARLTGDPSAAAMSAALLAGSGPDYLRDAPAIPSAPRVKTGCTGRSASGRERHLNCPGMLERLMPETASRGM